MTDNAISRLRDDLVRALSRVDGVNVSRVPSDSVKPPHLVVGEISLTPAAQGDLWLATAIVYVFVSAASAANIEQTEGFMAPDGELSLSDAIAVEVPSAIIEQIEDASVYQFGGVDYFGTRITVRAHIS